MEFEKVPEAIHSEKSSVTFKLSQDTNEMIQPTIDASGNSKDMNALAELCQISSEPQ